LGYIVKKELIAVLEREKMKFGMHTESWAWRTITPDVFPLILNEFVKAGFDGFETHDVDILQYLKNKEKFIAMLSEKGLQLAAIHLSGVMPTTDGFHPLKWFKNKMWKIRWVPKILKFASSIKGELPVRIVIVGGFRRVEGPKEDDFVNAAKILNKWGKFCKELNVEASYHPFYFNQLISSEDELSKLCELIDPDLVQLTLDVGHCLRCGCDPIEIIQSYREWINHIHFRDIRRDGTLVQLGDGIIDLKSIYKLLESIGYNGWVIAEHDWVLIERVKTTAVESIRKATEFVKTLRALS
jgi:sugar phosphate isomerase/epimerase